MSRGFRNADVTTELSDRAAAEIVERVHAQEVAQAQHAAERRELGQFGICEECGGAIEPERLEVLPDATRCVSCQSRTERRARRS